MNNYKSSLNGIIEAIVYIDNEALKIRDLAREGSRDSIELNSLLGQKNELYALKDQAMRLLSSQGSITTLGYFDQSLENSNLVTRVYKYESAGFEFYGVKPYDKNYRQLESLGDMGYLSPRDIDSDLTLEKSVEVLRDYLSGTPTSDEPLSQSIDTPANEDISVNSSQSYEFIDRKLVECHRLRVDESISLDSFSEEVPSLIDLASSSKKKYPDELELIVSKDKDPENKRRVIYKVKDNFATLLAVRELGLEKVYVNILAD